LTKREYFEAIAKSVLKGSRSDDEVLSLMIVLHTHEFAVSDCVTLVDAGEARVLAAQTRWGAADAVSSAFPADDRRLRYTNSYWYHQYCCRTPFEVIADVPANWRENVDAIIVKVKRLEIVSDAREEL
jgi:hypothetical protein